jgi:nuclear GTP-binding protein
VRKDKRDNPGKYRKKKDPGVPSECPFKEEVLREVEEMRKKKDEEKETRRKRIKEMREGKGRGQENENKDDAQEEQYEDEPFISVVPWEQVVKENSIILNLIDARRPAETLAEEITAAVLTHNKTVVKKHQALYKSNEDVFKNKGLKRLINVFTKSDLVTRDNLRDCLRRIRKAGLPAVAFRSSVLTQKKGSLEVRCKTVGVDSLMFLLQSFCKKLDRSEVTIGVVGRKGVGKRSLVQSLQKSKVFSLDKKLKLAETPGEVDDDEEEGVIARAEAFVARCDAKFLQLRYDVPAFQEPSEFLNLLAPEKKDGSKDLETAAAAFLMDVDGAKFKFCVEVGDQVEEEEEEEEKGQDDEEDVTAAKVVFNLEKVEKVEKGDLEQLPKLLDSDVMVLKDLEYDDDNEDEEEDRAPLKEVEQKKAEKRKSAPENGGRAEKKRKAKK